MKSGYDKFFKEARQAGQKGSSNKRPSIPRDRSSHMQFKLQTNSIENRKPLTPEQKLKLAMAKKVQKKQQEILLKKKKVPSFAIACVGAALAFSAIGYFFPHSLDFLSDHIEVGLLGQVQAAEEKKAETKTAIKERPEKNPEKNADGGDGRKEENSAAGHPEGAAKTASKETATKGETIPNVKNWSAEELSFFNKLSERKKELDLREAELTKLEEELQKQKAELDKKIQQLEKMRTEIASTLKSRVSMDQEKVDKLVQVYSSMKPQQAAKVIETLNEDLAVEVLDKMKKRSAADILNVMDAKKAQRLSEIMAGYKRPES